MPLPSDTSPTTGNTVPPYYIHSSSSHFRDTSGRNLLLRGINLSSSAKTPVGQPGSKLDGFWENGKEGTMSFVGRVLDLTNGKADQHLERLRNWGFNCLRYVITWESIEHAGPGQYDVEYIEYTVALLRKCKEHGFLVYIDPHQDLFSRFAGGSGAPYWTLIACGLNPENFTVTNAACIECEWPTPSSPYPADFPAMIWASNYSRLACQTLFTLWAAGRDYAPKCIIDGKNIQDWLEDHYFNAMKQLGHAIRDSGDLLDECVIGWDSLNEPNHGFLGTQDIREHSKDSILRIGPTPTAFEGMKLAMGQAVEVELWKFSSIGPKKDGKILIDPKGKRAWLDPLQEVDGINLKYGWKRGEEWTIGTCIWALHGVWNCDTDQVLRSDYFDEYRGDRGDRGGEGVRGIARKVDFGGDYWLPHWKRWAPIVRSFHPEAIHFIQSPVFQIPPKIVGNEICNRAAYSSHFYDGLTLVTKHWNWFNADALGILRGKYSSVLFGIKIGEPAIRKCLRDQLAVLRQDTFDALGHFPTMMGEIGIPFDLDKKKAYADGDYSSQVRALDASLNACDGTNVLNYTIWTYCPDNSHEWGDLWNGEDLTIWSSDDAERSIRFRNSASQLDLVGNILNTRSRSYSKVGSLGTNRSGANSKPAPSFGLQRSAPNPSSTRLTSSPLFASSPLHEAASTTTLQSTLVPPPFVGASLSSSPSFADSTTTVGSTTDPYALINLNDGARAVAAFCRPFPAKTVGVVKSINFDIRSSLFTLEIIANHDDVIASLGQGGRIGGSNQIPTEIYLPAIHYARYPNRVSQIVRNDINDAATWNAPKGSCYDGDGDEDADASKANHNSVRSTGATPARLVPSSGASSSSSHLPSYPNSSTSDQLLSLDITTSHGTTLLTGQTLLWYYDLPCQSEGERLVKIEIKREGGAIPSWIIALGDQPSADGRGIKDAMARAKELLCPPDLNCLIA